MEVADSSTGVVVADAVRFVSSGTGGGTGLFYVHADHLGTPQKMTDGTQALVWDAIYTPFGKAHAITGTASNNQRFPGQYVDQESSFHYNYFRDYDPSTGRYVQSDPIGLKGGETRMYMEIATRLLVLTLLACNPSNAIRISLAFSPIVTKDVTVNCYRIWPIVM